MMESLFYCYFFSLLFCVAKGRVKKGTLRLQFFHFRLFDTQCIERIPWFLIGNAHADPLRDNLLLSSKDGTAGMFGKATIHGLGVRVDVAKENSRVWLGFDVDTGVTEIGMSAVVGNGTVHDHGRHAGTGFELITGTIAVAMGCVPVRFRVVPAPAKVLDAHEIFLAVFFNVETQYVVGVLG
jgi:hypothetical protein